jgi:hypothetical protein
MSPSESETSSKPPENLSDPVVRRTPGNRFLQVLLTLLAIESGAFLVVMPWAGAWDWTLLEGSFGVLGSVLRNHFVRGAISGVGLLSLWVGFIEALVLTGAIRWPDVS